MSAIYFFREPSLPFFEAKWCNTHQVSYKRHFHEEYSIGLVEEGASKVWCDGKELQVEAGRLVCFPPYLPHACNPDPHFGWKYKMLFIQPDWTLQLFQDKSSLDAPFLPDSGKNRKCRDLLNQCMETFSRKSTPLEIETSVIGLVESLAHDGSDDLERRYEGRKERKRVKLVSDYLHEHFKERITLEELEAVAGVSKFHLLHLFKKDRQLPPHTYQNLLRINFAKKELCKHRPIADIALEAGFCDQSHFTKVFFHYVGVTPQKYAVSL